jgi:Protein of unknown function (DUF3592)
MVRILRLSGIALAAWLILAGYMLLVGYVMYLGYSWVIFPGVIPYLLALFVVFRRVFDDDGSRLLLKLFAIGLICTASFLPFFFYRTLSEMQLSGHGRTEPAVVVSVRLVQAMSDPAVVDYRVKFQDLSGRPIPGEGSSSEKLRVGQRVQLIVDPTGRVAPELATDLAWVESDKIVTAAIIIAVGAGFVIAVASEL